MSDNSDQKFGLQLYDTIAGLRDRAGEIGDYAGNLEAIGEPDEASEVEFRRNQFMMITIAYPLKLTTTYLLDDAASIASNIVPRLVDRAELRDLKSLKNLVVWTASINDVLERAAHRISAVNIDLEHGFSYSSSDFSVEKLFEPVSAADLKHSTPEPNERMFRHSAELQSQVNDFHADVKAAGATAIRAWQKWKDELKFA